MLLLDAGGDARLLLVLGRRGVRRGAGGLHLFGGDRVRGGPGVGRDAGPGDLVDLGARPGHGPDHDRADPCIAPAGAHGLVDAGGGRHRGQQRPDDGRGGRRVRAVRGIDRGLGRDARLRAGDGPHPAGHRGRPAGRRAGPLRARRGGGRGHRPVPGARDDRRLPRRPARLAPLHRARRAGGGHGRRGGAGSLAARRPFVRPGKYRPGRRRPSASPPSWAWHCRCSS
jgi:hypothetical protein